MKQVVDSVTKTLSSAVRSQQIAWVISTQGIAGGLAQVGITVGQRGLSWVGLASEPPSWDRAFGKNLSKTFMKLGPTFIKLGQVLATRPDFVGEEVADELKVLYDQVSPISFRAVRKILREEIGRKKIRRLFHSIDPHPLASASIAQTHRAVLKDGTPVILKVQKPGVAFSVITDLRLLSGLVKSMDRLYPKYQLKRMFEDFSEATICEIDYLKEAKNIDRFQKNYKKFFAGADVSFPSYFPDISTKRVLALEPMRGRKVNDLRKGSTVARKAAVKSLEAVLEQIFDHGFFHADPHAGNMFYIEDEGRLGFIDLGLVGQLEAEDKKRFLRVLMAVLKRDRARLARSLYELGHAAPTTDYALYESQIQEMIDVAKATGVANLSLEDMVNRLLAIARSNHIHIPNRYVMMLRSCLIIEGVAKSLDPNISVFSVATPIVARSLANSFSPFRLIRKVLP